MKKLLWITLILIIAIVTIHAMASTPAECSESAKEELRYADCVYNHKDCDGSEEDDYDEYLIQKHDDDKAEQQDEF